MVDVMNETEYSVNLEEVSRIAQFVMGQMHVASGVELNVIFIDPQPMEELHVKWLDLPGPTDVMSFPMDELRPGSEKDPVTEGILGDICICPQVAAAQAEEAGHSTMDEILMLTTHGILHLLGYDHYTPEEKEEMFALQRSLLLAFLSEDR